MAAVAVVVGLVLHGAMYGPQAAFLSELFGTTVRYSGVSIGYQLASILAGGLAPIIAVALLGAFHTGYAIAVYVALAAVVTIVYPSRGCGRPAGRAPWRTISVTAAG